MTVTAPPSASLDARPLHPFLGAELSGELLHDELDPGQVAELRRLVLEHKVLVFRGAALDPEPQIRFARYLGEPFARPDYVYGHLEGWDEIVKIGPAPVGQRPSEWHQGGTWKSNPWIFELLQLQVLPPVGGDTIFADLQAAYRALSPDLQRLVDGLRAAHHPDVAFKDENGNIKSPTSELIDHPLVLTHPETGQKGLYLTSRITHLIGLPPAESRAILAFLRTHASDVTFQYRHHWQQPGDLVIWDNRSVWHYAVDDYGDAERYGHKLSIEGGDWTPRVTASTLRVWNQLGSTIGDAIRAAVPDIEVVDIDPRPDLHPGGLGPPATVLYTQPLYGKNADEVAAVDTSWADGVEWVQSPSAGIDKVPPGLLQGRLATCGRGVMSGPIAEYVLAALLAHRRGIPAIFVDEPTPPGFEKTELPTLEGSTLGLIGFGSIAQAIAVRALPFGVEVLATRRSERPPEVDGVTIVPLPELVARSDSLIVAAPATPATASLLDARLLQSAKPGVHVVNIARGSLIDQEALLQALDDGTIGHATLDVTTPEPLPAGHPLYSHPRVSISPHVSFSFPGIGGKGLERFLANLARFRAGEELEGLVDAEAGY